MPTEGDVMSSPRMSNGNYSYGNTHKLRPVLKGSIIYSPTELQ